MKSTMSMDRQHRSYICQYNRTVLVCWSDYGKESFEVQKIEEVEMRDAYMHMLLHLNEDFDDDLSL